MLKSSASRHPTPKPGAEDELKARCWQYVECWLVRYDFPACDYLRYRQTLIGRLQSDRGAPERAGDRPDPEHLVDEFLRDYGRQHLRVKRREVPKDSEPGARQPPNRMVELCRQYVFDPTWRRKYREKPAVAIARLLRNRPKASRGVTEGEVGGEFARPGSPDDGEPSDREWFNQLALEVLARYLRDYRGTRFAKLLCARALEPFAEGRSKAPAYQEICEQCGYTGEGGKRRAELAWPRVQEQVRRTLRRVVEERAANTSAAHRAPEDSDAEQRRREREATLVEQEINEFHRLLGQQARLFGMGRNTKDQDALRQYIRELDQPGISTATVGGPDLSNCSLDLIALLLTEDPPQIHLEDRQDQWQRSMTRSLGEWTASESSAAADVGGPSEAEPVGWLERPIGQLVHHPQPPLDPLIALKTALRARYKAGDAGEFRETLVAGYLTCIAAALVATGQAITRKKPDQLANDLRWLADQEWLDAATGELAKQALGRLASS